MVPTFGFNLCRKVLGYLKREHSHGRMKSSAMLSLRQKTPAQADEAVDDEEAALRLFANLYEHIVEAYHPRERGTTVFKEQSERL